MLHMRRRDPAMALSETCGLKSVGLDWESEQKRMKAEQAFQGIHQMIQDLGIEPEDLERLCKEKFRNERGGDLSADYEVKTSALGKMRKAKPADESMKKALAGYAQPLVAPMAFGAMGAQGPVGERGPAGPALTIGNLDVPNRNNDLFEQMGKLQLMMGSSVSKSGATYKSAADVQRGMMAASKG